MFDNAKTKVQQLSDKLPKPFKNFFVVSLALFIVWMLILDRDRLPRQIRKYFANQELKEEVEYYNNKIEVSEKRLQGLQNDPEKLEKLAREKYYMHKPNEDVYVIQKETVED